MGKTTENNQQSVVNATDSHKLLIDLSEHVIWDSGSGYEIGYFLGEGVTDDTWLIDIMTGLTEGPCSYPKSEVFKYTDELVNKLTAKYSYKKRFSDLF